MRVSPLLSDILRSHWAMSVETALMAGHDLMRLLNRDWDGMPAQSLDDRAPLPVGFVFAASGETGASLDKAPKGSTAIIPLKGTMLKYGTMCTYGTTEIAGALLEAASHKNIGSIVIDTDSGGGAVDAVAPMIEAISEARAKYGKPVVALCDLCASAAYWAASACDKIIASNDISSQFGSIGVMMSFADVKPYYEKMGIKFHTIYAPESTHKNREFELALEGKYDEIQKLRLSPLAVKFQNAVKQNRGSKLNTEAPGILNGAMFYASDAVKFGLCDQVGNMNTAITIARDLADKSLINNYINSKKS